MRTPSVRLTALPSNAYNLIRLLAWLRTREYEIALADEMPSEWQPAMATNSPRVVMHPQYQDSTPIQKSVGIEEIRAEPVLSMISEEGCVPILQDHETQIPQGCYVLVKEKRR